MLARWVVHPRAGPLGATLTNDFERCLQSYVGARASFEKGRVEGLKISPWAPQKEAKIDPKCPLGGLPGESLGGPGRPWGAETDFCSGGFTDP